ncbi:response regulator, partial [Acinetobacter baumannii]
MPISKILVVDDSPTELFFVSDLLTRNGYTVTTAQNGEEAISKIKLDKPELIVMDVIMPGQNGFQVTRSITKDPETSGIP